MTLEPWSDRDFPTAMYDDAAVLWDVQDYPIPDGADPKSFFDEINEALKGPYRGKKVPIYAYVNKNTLSDDLLRKFEDAGITIHDHSLGSRQRPWSMLVDLYLLEFTKAERLNLIVLSKQFTEDTADYLEALHCLDFGVFLSKTKEHWGLPRESWISFLTQKFLKRKGRRSKGRSKGRSKERSIGSGSRSIGSGSIGSIGSGSGLCMPSSVSIESLETFTGDFPVALGSYSDISACNCVFWVMDNGEILKKLKPCEMIKRLKICLSNKGYGGSDLVIRGHVVSTDNLSEDLLYDYGSHVLTFSKQLEGGESNQLLVDILIMAMHYCEEQTNMVILFGGESYRSVQGTKFREVCECMRKKGLNVVVARSDKLVDLDVGIESLSQTEAGPHVEVITREDFEKFGFDIEQFRNENEPCEECGSRESKLYYNKYDCLCGINI